MPGGPGYSTLSIEGANNNKPMDNNNHSSTTAAGKKAGHDQSASAKLANNHQQQTDISLKLNGHQLHAGDRGELITTLQQAKASGQLTVDEDGQHATYKYDSPEAKYFVSKARLQVVGGYTPDQASKMASKLHGTPGDEPGQKLAAKRGAIARARNIQQARDGQGPNPKATGGSNQGNGQRLAQQTA